MITDFNKVFPADDPESKGPESHIFKAEEILAMKEPVNQSGLAWNHLDFRGEAFLDLLKQDGARGIRAFPAFNGHHLTLAFLALDADGNELVSGDAIGIENGQRCPPFC